MRTKKREVMVVGLLFLDQITKYLFLRLGQGVINSGVSFGVLLHCSFIPLLIFLFLVFLTVFYIKHPRCWFILLILTGGISNLLDRLFYGGVVDFISLPHFPSFNLADSMICAGCFLLGIDLLKTEPL